MFLVVGGNGQVGGAVPRSPAARGAPAGALVRTPRWLGGVEGALRAGRMAATRLRAATFMQKLLASAGEVGAAGTLSAPAGEAAIALVDTLDLGAAGAAPMMGDGHGGGVVEATGTEKVAYAGVARRLAAVLGRLARHRPISLQELRDRLEGAGLPAPLIEVLVGIWDHMASGGMAAPVTDAVERLTGAPPRPRDALIADHADRCAAVAAQWRRPPLLNSGPPRCPASP